MKQNQNRQHCHKVLFCNQMESNWRQRKDAFVSDEKGLKSYHSSQECYEDIGWHIKCIMSPNSCIKDLISWFQTFKKQSLCFYSLFSLGKLTLGQGKTCTQDSCKGQGHSQAHNSSGHLWRRCWIRVCRETNSVKCIPSFTLNCTFGGKLLSSKLHRRLPLF